MMNVNDKNQKVMMYTMNGMFVLLFNSFPAGLNLYYVVYNFLNYIQQQRGGNSSFLKKIKALLKKQENEPV